MVRVRFAPSPTGYLHVGGARTALFNWLFARKEGGKFILRIEDTDVERSRREYEERLKDALLWLGLEWDEFYRQSDRLELYQSVAESLVEQGKAYYVYAYPEEIEELRKRLLSEGKPPHYDQTMLSVYDTPQRRREYEEKGLRPAIYFKMPRKEYSFDDVVKGRVVFKEGTIGDFAILRSNGLPTYNFAVVVDDIDMGITHVIRGDDHLSNTLRQLAIYEALQKTPPIFAHVSMILGPDGTKLSKRHGATSVEEMRNRGILPEALRNYLLLLGWSHPEGKEIMSLDEMIESFSLERLGKNPAIFDYEKLRWMNSVYVRKLETDELLERAAFILKSAGFDLKDPRVKTAIEILKDRIKELGEIPKELEFLKERPEASVSFDENEREILETVLSALKDSSWNVESILKAFRDSMRGKKIKARDFFHKLRLALTGKEEGMELENIIFLLGYEEFSERIRRCFGRSE